MSDYKSLEVDATALEYIREVYASVQLFKVHYFKTVVPQIEKNPNLLRSVGMGKTEWLEGVESMVNVMLKKWLDGNIDVYMFNDKCLVILNTIGGILNKQKKTEYRSKEEPQSLHYTPTCEEMCSYIRKVFTAIKTYFEPDIQVVLLTEFGIEIYE